MSILGDFLDDYSVNEINESARALYQALQEFGASNDQIDRIDAIITEIMDQ